jgi:hypothetical protein
MKPLSGSPAAVRSGTGKFTGKIHFSGEKVPSTALWRCRHLINGKAAGIWLSPLTDRDGRLEAIGGEDLIMGNDAARFVAAEQPHKACWPRIWGGRQNGLATIPIPGWWCGWPVMTAPGTPGP